MVARGGEGNNLDQAIYNIRKALGDSRDAPRFIVTVAGRGYQFIADTRPDTGDAVSDATPAAEAPAIEAAPTPVTAPAQLSRRWLLAAGDNDSKVDSKEEIWEVFPNNLDSTEKTIVDMRIDGCSFKQIGQTINLTYYYVRKNFKAAIKKLKEANTI